MAYNYEDITFVNRQSTIFDKDNNIIFDETVEFPDFYDDNSVNVISSKYLCNSDKIKETSIKDIFNRVANTISEWGYEQGYFKSDKEKEKFCDYLKYYQIHQYFAFNSPVYFNLGLRDDPQISACFILGIEDTMESITDMIKVESKIFKQGSGSGLNFSSLRSSKEPVSAGGKASGPVSFLKVSDVNASVIKSGGTLRRSAKMGILNIEHPDIEEFIICKKEEEEKLKALIDAGINPKRGQELSDEVFFQNTNISVRFSKEFMEAVEQNKTFWTKFVKTGEKYKEYNARDLLMMIAKNAWESADPGVQYNDNTNDWNTCPNSGSINASNPCIPNWAPVLTPDGYKRLHSLKNKIFLKNSKECSDVFKTKENDQVYEIKLKSGLCVYANKDHKITTNNGDIELKNLNIEKDQIKVHYPKLNYEFNNDSYEKGFICGYLFADGSLYYCSSKNRLFATFSLGDKEFLLENNLIKLIHKHIPSSSNRYFSPHFQKPETCKVLTLMGESTDQLINFFGKSKDDFDLFEYDISFQKGFIEAMITFDGHVLNRGYSKHIAIHQSGDRGYDILSQIQTSLTSFGVYSYLTISNHAKTIKRENGKNYNYQTVYNLTINDVWEFDKIFSIYNPTKAQRIKDIVTIPKKHPNRISNYKLYQPIVSIKKHSIEDVYDIVVPDGNHFVTNSAIVHNCGEYIFLDDSSCNLASINLLKFLTDKDTDFNLDEFKRVIDLCVKSQDIIINKANYPTEKIKQNSIDYRPLGLGYTNLGSFLMVLGFPYDSDNGRSCASAITSLLTGCAYNVSGRLSKHLGPFKNFPNNSEPMLNIIKKHISEHNTKSKNSNSSPEFVKKIYNYGTEIWNTVKRYNEFRNSQVTLLAPTGTISYIMGATTTGIEPEFSHIKYKRLSNSDGSMMTMVNPLLERSLINLKYNNDEIRKIKQDILDNKSFDEIEILKDEHKSIFHTSMSTPGISYMGHLKIQAAVQPFLSGAISKTINMPNNCTVEDIYNIYLEGWRMGLKGLTIYRDGSKNFQPLSSKKEEKNDVETSINASGRRKLPDERPALNHKFLINNNFKGYLSCGLHEDGSLGEIFIDVAKEGSTISGILKSLAVVTSISLQYGVPLKDLIKKLSYQRFEPNGFTANKDIRICHSVVDYVFRYLGNRFLSDEDKKEIGLLNKDNGKVAEDSEGDAISGPPCNVCGSIMMRKGMCYMCLNCGNNEGSCG
ncbi:MAG: hypothetical protein ACOC2W_00140 [bacterium]